MNEPADNKAPVPFHPEGGGVDTAPRPHRKKNEALATEDLLASVNRQLPFSDEAEKGILSCVLQDPEELLPELRRDCPIDAFFRLPERTVLQTLFDMHDKALPIDVVSISNVLRDRGLLDRVGGASAISELYTFVPIAAHFAYYLKIVLSKWHLRMLIHASAENIHQAYEHGKDAPDADATDVIAGAEARVFAVLEQSRTGKGSSGPVHSNEVVNEVIDHILKLQSNKGRIMGVSTGWPDLDRVIGAQGLEPGDVFVCGARPKMGKTNVLCSMVKAIAVDQGNPTLVLSLEMSRRRLWNRIMFGGFDIETSKASNGFLEKAREQACDDPGDDDGDLEDNGTMTRGDQENLARSQRMMGRAPLWVDDAPMNTNDLRSVIRLWVRRHAAPYIAANPGKKICIAIDYLQLVDAVTKMGMSEERLTISEAMKTIHSLAKDRGINAIFIVLAQANRSAESNPRHEPGAKDYDGGSAIEKFLDYGSFIHRPSRYKRWTDLDEKTQNAFKAIVQPKRKANPELWSDPVPVRNGLGGKVKDEQGRVKLEWDPEIDWNEHALLLLPLNRNGDEARIWLRFRKEFTRFDSRTPALYSNNAARRQAGYQDKLLAPAQDAADDQEETLFEED